MDQPTFLSSSTALSSSNLSPFAKEVQKGLVASASFEEVDCVIKHKSKKQKKLTPALLYDEEGSKLFEQICGTDDYYLTRAETEILQKSAKDIVSRVSPSTLVTELGSGSSIKTRLLIDAFLKQHNQMHYIPLDISTEFLRDSAQELFRLFPSRNLQVTAIAAEYRDGLKILSKHFPSGQNILISWLGSSIGNFPRADAVQFLRELLEMLEINQAESSQLLIGIDLKKDRRVLEAAYNDAEGVTEKFIKNVLTRINRELDADFDRDSFRYQAIYNEAEGAVEMMLFSLKDQTVTLKALNTTLHFDEGESIHVESSYKYSQEEISQLAKETNLSLEHQWVDSTNSYSLNLFTLNKEAKKDTKLSDKHEAAPKA